MTAANCFSDVAVPVNPINQAILDVFGDNYFPKYDPNYQPASTESLANENLLELSLPGGGQIKPPVHAEMGSFGEILAPIMSGLSSVLSFFGPIFIILDVIQGIIDVICALFNPEPIISAVIRLFVEVLPPLIALFPPFASILLALNVVKTLTAAGLTILTSTISILDEILSVSAQITEEISAGNFFALDAISSQICLLLKEIDNQLGIFSGFSLILQIIDLFMSIGSGQFCSPSNECCDEDSCPPIIVNPAFGAARISNVVAQYDVDDLINDIIGIFTDPLEDIVGFLGIELEIPDANTGLDFVFTYPAMQVNTISRVSGENSNGLVSSVGVGYNYSASEFAKYTDFIVKNEFTQESEETHPTTLRARLVASGQEIIAKVKKVNSNGSFVVATNGFNNNTIVQYEMQPDLEKMLAENLVGLGCVGPIGEAQENLNAYINDGGGLDPVTVKIGGPIPRPPLEDLQRIIDEVANDPTQDKTGDFAGVINGYLGDLADVYDKLVCVGANGANSEFQADSNFAFVNSGSVTLSLKVNDIGGSNLLVGALPQTTSNVQFFTNHGTVGPVSFDSANNQFIASLTADEAGIAEVTAIFAIDDDSCMTPQESTGDLVFQEKRVTVNFVNDTGEFARRRNTKDYVESKGGRRR